MLKDEDRIFKNLYNDLGWDIESSIKRGDWSQIKDIISSNETNQAFYLLNAEYFTTYYGNAPQIKRDNYVEL